jgi:nicotinate-nucleotide pyrophosphorylase (carboxylating)
MVSSEEIRASVAIALAEDIGTGDISTNLLQSKEVHAEIITREKAVICGQAWVEEVYRQLDSSLKISWLVKEGQYAMPDQVLSVLSGDVKSLLTGERTALNFLQMLSGTATLTRRYVTALKDTPTQLLDTRKTIPGLRHAQKYAVRCAGGQNHRLGLFDAFLIKENHIQACGSIQQAIMLAREMHPDKTIEVEVENLEELKEALEWGADIILLDNFDLSLIKQAVVFTAKRSKLEVSGNVAEDQLAQIAATGIDFISVGALTKHIKAIDLSMLIRRVSI